MLRSSPPPVRRPASEAVVLLGVTITAESEVGVGTTITVRIGDYEG